jgi:hypothetical protein
MHVSARSCFETLIENVIKLFLCVLSKNNQVVIRYNIYTIYTIWTKNITIFAV